MEMQLYSNFSVLTAVLHRMHRHSHVELVAHQERMDGELFLRLAGFCAIDVKPQGLRKRRRVIDDSVELFGYAHAANKIIVLEICEDSLKELYNAKGSLRRGAVGLGLLL